MDDAKVTAAELKKALAGDFDRMVEKIVAAMNSAQPGRIIEGDDPQAREPVPVGQCAVGGLLSVDVGQCTAYHPLRTGCQCNLALAPFASPCWSGGD